MGSWVRVLLAPALAVAGLCVGPETATAQSLPASVRVGLANAGHDDLAERLDDRMTPRSSLDRGDVEDLLERWEDRTGGPAGAWEWLTVARLWLRAGEAGRATDALDRAARDGRLPAGTVALERARIAYLAGETARATEAYWEACAEADELSALEAWRDLEVLATPAEIDAWDRHRRVPAGQRDDCRFFRSFWNERSARSAMPVGERIAAHYDRLRFAMDHFVRRGRAQDVAASGKLNARLGREGPPRFDDRGLLYLRLGPPDETTRTIGGDCYEPNVSWFYRFPDGNRMYHLSPIGGNDNWWLLSNLGEIFRCSLARDGRVAEDRNPMVAVPALLNQIPGGILHDIYITRAQLDPRYARMAFRALRQDGSTEILEVLQDERDLTWSDGQYAITEVPERPDVRMDVGLLNEWIAFRPAMPDLTRMWLLLLVSGEDLADIDDLPDDGLEVVVTALGPDGTQEVASGRLSMPAPGSDAVVRLPLDLRPGTYEATVVVRAGPPRGPNDDGPPPSGGYTAAPLAVPEFSEPLPRLSGIAVSPDSGGAWAQSEEVALSPSPIHVAEAGGSLWIYFEAYNLTPGGRYAATVRMEPEDGGTPFDLEFTGLARTGGRIVTPVALRLDFTDAVPGPYRLELTVRDLATGRVTLPARTDVTIR